MEKLKKPLLHPNDYLSSVDICTSLAAYLSEIIYTKNYLLTFTDDLLLLLLKLSCDTTINSDYLSSDSIWEAQTAWQDALTLLSSCLPRNELETTMDKIVSFIQKSLEMENMSEEKLESIIRVSINLCQAIYKATPLEMNGVLNKLFNHSILIDQRNCISGICNWAEYINGKLSSCYNEFESVRDVKMDCQMLQFFIWLYVKINVLIANVEDKMDEDEEEAENSENIWSILDMRVNWIAQTFYDLELGKCFLDNYGTVSKFQNWLL